MKALADLVCLVYSREEIFEAVRVEGTCGEVTHGYGTQVPPARKARGRPSNLKHIEAVWGMGYRSVDSIKHIFI
ncbi:MAG TPA: hypothetical protein VMV90_06955 [Rectinemataceae bacterium]|nr:hypothetical protein [Rectinemataceae bacterium]